MSAKKKIPRLPGSLVNRGMKRKTTPVPHGEALVEQAWQLWDAAWKGERASGPRLTHWLTRSPENVKAFLLIVALAMEAQREADLPQRNQ